MSRKIKILNIKAQVKFSPFVPVEFGTSGLYFFEVIL